MVSTVTAGAADLLAADVAASARLVFDVVYTPWPTVLADTVSRAGGTVLSGLDLLVGQALRQIELMTGGSRGRRGAVRRAGQPSRSGSPRGGRPR